MTIHSLPLPLSRLLLLVALVLLPVSASETTQNLIDWIVSQGGEYNPKQAEQTFQNGKMRGIFATQDIFEGEVLLRVPWDSILGAKGATHETRLAESIGRQEHILKGFEGQYMAPQCRVIKEVYQEAQKKEDSFFVPYLRYLSLLSDDSDDTFLPQIPAMWSQEARDLLEDINDHGGVPPYQYGLFTTMNHDWFGACIEDIQNNPLEKKVTGTVAAHGSLANLGMLVPLLDNYHYNQVPNLDDVANVYPILKHGNSVALVATTDIPAGTEILRSFSEYQEEDIWTIDAFVESGIIDDFYYPKSYEFLVKSSTRPLSFVIEVDMDEDGDLYAMVLEVNFSNQGAVDKYLSHHIHRLRRIESVVLAVNAASSIEEFPENSTMSPAEWTTLWKYHHSILQTMELGLASLREETMNDDFCPGGHNPTSEGSCPIWDGFEDVPNDAPLNDMNLEFDVLNPYGPSETAYSLCNNEEDKLYEDYKKAGDVEVLRSQYQDIYFFVNPTGDDMVMKLDSTIQQASSYRPHYHEFAVHFPARFLESVENVLFVGGGDSMVLHEVLKYPTLKKVVGLELDQYVLRNSFRYFNSQPHFDDRRVEWWFGDGAKSLLMLPKDYFQSFDLVVVDLSETVMSFQVTAQLSIFQTLSLLLKPDGILLKNGEYYMDNMSGYFDYTLQFFEFDVPYICDQGMVIGSNKIDFYNRSLKDHGVDLLVLESQEEINDKFSEFYRFTEYRKNDALKQGQCEDVGFDESSIKNAGILMVVEAENVKQDMSSLQAVEGTIIDTLKNIGFSIESTVREEPSTIIVLTKEGYVTARLHPEKSYVGLDIKLWANFDLMETARDALVQSLGGSVEGTSSFRIVTGGMGGSPFEELDRTKIGPRVVNNRNCEPSSTPASDGTMVDLKKSGLESSLEMVEDGVVAAVVCGSVEEECKSLEILKKAPTSKLQKVLPIYTCASMSSEGDEFSPLLQAKMAKCEIELSNALSRAGDKISLLAVDDSANQIMGKALFSIFSNVWNRKRLFSQHRFIALVDNNTDSWPRNLLALIREKIIYKPMSFVDLVLENSKEQSKLSLLSIYDEKFFLHLKEMLTEFNNVHGEAAKMEVDKIFDGLATPQTGHFKPKKFKIDDYDPIPAQEQLAGQTSLGRQSLVQFETKNADAKITVSMVESALSKAIPTKEVNFHSFEGNANIGDGLVVVAFSVDGITQVILSWDGRNHIDVNLYSSDENPVLRTNFIDAFVKEFAEKIEIALSDTHPRGVGRVVSFPGHMN